MKAVFGWFTALFLMSIASMAVATIFFEEPFNAPTLDPQIWRTEILTNGARWCDSNAGGWWGPGVWVEEGVACYGVSVQAPYGTAVLSDGLLQLASGFGRTFPYLASRLPGAVDLFPPLSDFTLRIRMRYDRVTAFGNGVVVLQSESTEPSGTNPPGLQQNLLLQMWCHTGMGGVGVFTALGGSVHQIAVIPPPDEFHEFVLACQGDVFTISVDDELVFGPVTSDLRPTAIWMGNPALVYWGASEWTGFSVDYIRVEVPGSAMGACCFPDGSCRIMGADECQGAGGTWLGYDVPCNPNPCVPSPVEISTWGSIRRGYR